MPSVSLGGLRTGLNNYYWIKKAVIKIDSGRGELTEIKISNGNMLMESRQWINGSKHHKSVFVPGKGYREWCGDKLITTEKYTPGTLRSRVGVCRYKKKLFGKSVTHLQKRSAKGGFSWEEVYWPSGKLMYRYSRGQKKGKFFDDKGNLWGIFDGELEWTYLHTKCILAGRGWRNTTLQDLLRDGPNLKDNNGSFTWYDKKGRVRFQGIYKDNQKTGIWIDDYVESVYIRGVSVPKTLADAKPEDIDVYKVVSEKNAQRRAVLIEKIGIHRVINELKGEIIDEDKINDFSLINIRLAAETDKKFQGDRIMNLLKVKCPSTGAFYTLRVPPGIKDVHTARQWTFGVALDSESKLREEALEFIKET